MGGIVVRVGTSFSFQDGMIFAKAAFGMIFAVAEFGTAFALIT